MCILAESNPNGLGRKKDLECWFIHWWDRGKTTEHLDGDYSAFVYWKYTYEYASH